MYTMHAHMSPCTCHVSPCMCVTVKVVDPCCSVTLAAFCASELVLRILAEAVYCVGGAMRTNVRNGQCECEGVGMDTPLKDEFRNGHQGVAGWM